MGQRLSQAGVWLPYNPADGREDLMAGTNVLRVLRGGSWNYDQGLARCAVRGWSNPYGRGWSGGFRLVVSAIF
jgi:formylglycine-generating enzyme required for sulfatase activity